MKDKAREEFIHDLLEGPYVAVSNTQLLRDGFDAGYDAARPQWVKIEDGGLPEKDGGYLAAWRQGDGTIETAELYLHADPDDKSIRRWEAGGDGWPDDFPVFAWMPIPPYEEKL